MTQKQLLTDNHLCTSNVCKPSYFLLWLSAIMGGGSMVLFLIFLFTGLPSIIDFGIDGYGALYINTILSLLFFLQHSLMVRKGFRQWVTRYLPQDHFAALYSTFSGLFLLILMLFWQKSTSVHIELTGTIYWIMRSLFLFAIISLYFTVRTLKFDLLGIRDIITYMKGKTSRGSIFTVRGAYQRVRHPLYFLCLLLIWSQVSVTTDRLLFNGLFTVWIIIGTILEERDLVASFGDDYRYYQQTVPMLIPYKWFPLKKNQNK